MKRVLLIPLLAVLFSGYSQSLSLNNYSIDQSPVSFPGVCKSDKVHIDLMKNDPVYAAKRQEYHKKMADYLKISPSQRSLSGVVTIPVVVHVIYNPSIPATNISTAQINSAINNLNDAYSNDATLYGNSQDIQVQFALAQRDENCNATTGIVRVDGTSVSGYSTDGITSANETSVKALSKWNNSYYYNIWIVTEIDGNDAGVGTQGYAYFPGASAAKDGAVILYNAFGYDPTETLGYELKSYTNYNVTAIHEIGHGLDLYHTFEGDDANADVDPYPGYSAQCPVNDYPMQEGDMCEDTDPHQRGDSDCDIIQNTCHGVSNSEVYNNFMAYSSDQCQDRFTSDQKNRMRGALELERPGLVTSLGATVPPAQTPNTTMASCEPQSSSQPNEGVNGGYGGIMSVSFGSVNSSTSNTANDHTAYGTFGYLDFSQDCNSYAEVSVGETVDVSVTTWYNAQVIDVYVDWNNNSVFDSGEEVLSLSTSQNTSAPYTSSASGQFVVPAGANTDEYLRIRFNADIGSVANACEAPTYGQVEDYALYVVSSGTPPTAAFSANTTSICPGESVTFTDASTDSPTSWSWDFGDTGSSTSQNPSHTYSSAGVYTVTLTATNAGGSDDEVKIGYITVNALPNLSNTSSTNESCTGSDGSATVSPTGGSSYSYSWDASAGSQTTATATSLTAGTYSVVVQETTSGCSANTDVTVNNSCAPAPTAAFSADVTTICEGESVTFTDASTNSPISWSWDFGDTGSSTSQNPSHTYSSAGVYTVTLTATNAGGSDDEVKIGYITVNALPNLSNTSSTDESCTGSDGSATVSPTGGSSYSYSWDASAGSQTTATATSLTAGTYNVVVQETNSGCSANTDVTVNNSCAPAPTAAFSADVTTVCAGESVTFTDASTNSPTSWSWDFGDTGSSTSQNPSHTYSSAGTYTVTLTATNASGSDDEVKTGYITVNALDDATFNYGQGSYCMSDSDPTPTISGTQNGSFSSTPGGLTIDPNTGVIDLSASTPNTYTVRYTTPGTCSDYHDVQVIVDGCVPDTKVRADYCGNILTSVNDAIYCDAVSGATEYEWEITDPSNNVHTYVRLNGIEYVRLSYFGLGDPNTIYSVRVRAQVNGIWGNFNTVCTVTTPASLPAVQLSTSSCNITLNKIDDFFYCDDVLGADYYEWEFTDPSNNVTTYVRTNGTPNMKLVYAGLYATSTQYDVRVRGNFGGQWGPYGASCTITSPATGLTTQVTANDCGRVLNSFTQVIYCDKVLGATYYQWKFTDASNNVKTYVRLNGTTYFKLAYINLPALNTQYDVQVRAYVNGAWQSYGSICQITSPSTSAISIADNDPEILELVKIGVFAPDPAADIEENNIFSETVVYPNPFKENLNVTFGNNEVKQITIYNAVGQVVTNMTTSESQLTFSTNEFVNGVYLMQVVSDDQTKTIRLVKH